MYLTEDVSETITKITIDDREISLIGTAHVSAESVREVEEEIQNQNPERICVEIDENRYKSLKNDVKWKDMDLFKAIREKKGFLLLANLVLGSFQKRIGMDLGYRPGEEMASAVAIAQEKGIPFTFSDRPVEITLRRVWGLCGIFQKMKLLAAMLSSLFVDEKVSEEDIENLKSRSVMEGMMKELADYLPNAKGVLIDERDRFLASSIFGTTEKKVVAVVGAGHCPGIIDWMQRFYEKRKEPQTDSLMEIPSKNRISKIIPWLLPAIYLAVIVCGFVFFGKDKGFDIVITWLISNGIPSGIGALIALAHPVTIIVSIAAAPITSLNPTIGAGMVAAICEWFIKKPRIGDAEGLGNDIATFRGWYKNRISHILLILLFVSLGSVLGSLLIFPVLTAYSLF